MCKPKPGPRCTPHIRKPLDNASTRIDSARAALEENPSHTRLQRRVAAAETAYSDTRDLYDSTPGGQNELRAAMAAEPDPERRVELKRRLAAGQQLRAEQTEALRRVRTSVADNDNEKENTMDEPMTQERREGFWRQYGWSPELPAAKRAEIEKYWSDPEIEEAQALGF